LKNDQLAISHSHDIDDGSEDGNGNTIRDDASSTGSVIRSPPATPGTREERHIYTSSVTITTEVNCHVAFLLSPNNILLSKDIDSLISLSSKVRLSSDVRAYLHDIVVFTRMHRAVAGGVSALATRHLYALVKYVSLPIYFIYFH
jgi:hypothetical protein